MAQLDRIKELVELLNEASKAYYQESREIMPNIEYDRLYDELVELEKETDISQYSDVKAIARSYSCDDVLFMLDNNIYRIYHLTYSTHNENGFPRFMEFVDTSRVIAYIEKQFIEEYL